MQDHAQHVPAPAPAAPSRQESAERTAGVGNLLQLQRAAGNHAVLSLVQAKLTVGPANDPHEREADAVAKQVLARLKDPSADGAGPVRRATSFLRRKGGDAADPLGGTTVDAGIESRINASSGKALPTDVLSSMSSGFGHDFSNVRVHTGDEAGALNRSLGAKAFTKGSDIFFGAGAFDPGSSGGQELLAHELTHVVQQGAAPAI